MLAKHGAYKYTSERSVKGSRASAMCILTTDPTRNLAEEEIIHGIHEAVSILDPRGVVLFLASARELHDE